MSPVTINNPILNSPYHEPKRHFRFDAENQITNIIDAGRRGSSYFLPIAAPKKKGTPGLFDDSEEKKLESGFVNRVRQLVQRWRALEWPDITPMTRTLLQRWLHRPNTILVDGRQLESGESMSNDFKKLAAHQIDDFKAEYRRRFPDLVVKIDDGRGTADLLNLLLEVSGQKKKEKEAKVQTTKTMWVPGVNNLGTFGRWDFLEIDGSNLHKAKPEIRKVLKSLTVQMSLKVSY